jgi:LmbE family N-acetylglucosaminyl deacetylase
VLSGRSQGRRRAGFRPDLFLDIADVRDLKKEACFCHKSQSPEGFWAVHEDMHRRRGEESGVRYAEAFVLAEPLVGKALLPVAFLKKKSASERQ